MCHALAQPNIDGRRMNTVSTLDVLEGIFDRAGDLVAVTEHRFEGDAGFVVRVDLEFDALVVAVVAEEEFDTIALMLDLPEPEDDATVHTVTDDLPWSIVVGKHVRWGWLMTNHVGNEDGIQIEFTEKPEASGVTIQMMVVASAIYYFDVTPQTHRQTEDGT